MLHILSLLNLLFWLVIIPFCIGLIPAGFISAEKRNPGFVMLAGYFVMWAVFEVVAIPAVLFVQYDNFKTASGCFTVLAILSAAVGLWLMYRNHKSGKPGLVWGRSSSEIDAGVHGKGGRMAKKTYCDTGVSFLGRIVKKMRECMTEHITGMSWAERIEWLLFFGLLGFQLYKAAAYASFDGDDAYYVVESLIAQQADVMYRILPYTGRPTDLDIRHALAVFPMWIAHVAARSGIHATIMSHSIMPFVLIPLSYLVYYEIGKMLFREEEDFVQGKKENLPIFMILIGMFQIFGNVSIYTNETFFLTRTWQGKAVAGSLVIPALFWMFLRIYGGGARSRSGGRRRDRRGIGGDQAQESRSDQGRRVRQIYRSDKGLWLVFVCVNMAAGICSSIAVFLVCMLMALTALCLAVVERDFKVLVKMGAVCIPNVIYMAIYVIVGYSYLLR